MDQRSRTAIVIAIAVIAAALAVFLVMRTGAPADEDGLQKLSRRFMECLPEETSDSARDEIRGILERFHNRAVMDEIHPVDRLAIEHDMIAYVEAGEIPQDELFTFMSRIGEATRRFEDGQEQEQEQELEMPED